MWFAIASNYLLMPRFTSVPTGFVGGCYAESE